MHEPQACNARRSAAQACQGQPVGRGCRASPCQVMPFMATRSTTPRKLSSPPMGSVSTSGVAPRLPCAPHTQTVTVQPAAQPRPVVRVTLHQPKLAKVRAASRGTP